MQLLKRVKLEYVSVAMVAVAVVILLLYVSKPLLGGFLLSDDGVLHLYRVLVLDHALQFDGTFYPRFSSGFVYGYGSGLFNYFSPLAYYSVLLPYRLGLPLISSWALANVFFWVLAFVGAYQLGKYYTQSQMGGWITGVAYGFSPYLLFDLVARGTLTELSALAILPYVILAMHRLVDAASYRSFLAFLMGLVVFVPLHNIVTMHSVVLLAPLSLYALYQRGRLLQPISALMLAISLTFLATAFYWMPALTETNDVKINTVTDGLNFVDPTNYLRPATAVFEGGRTPDPEQLRASVPISLSLNLLGLVAISLLFGAYSDALPRLLLALFIFLIWLSTPSSAWFWENIPLLSYTQFAWRIIGVSTLVLALLAGIGAKRIADALASKLAVGLFSLLVTLGLLISVNSWMYRPLQEDVALEMRDVWQFEHQSGQLSLSSYAEYLPSLATEPDYAALATKLTETTAINRLPDHRIQVISARWTTLGVEMQYRSDQAQAVTLQWLYMPGWRATLDGEPLQVYPQPDSGLLTVALPAGTGRLEISRGLTVVQAMATNLSVIAFFLIFPVAAFFSFRPRSSSAVPIDRRLLLSILVSGSLALIVKTLSDTTDADSLLRRSKWDEGHFYAEHQFGTSFDNGMRLLASTETDQAGPGDTLHIDTFWSLSHQPISENYSLVYELLDANDLVVARLDRFLPGDLATSHWQSGFYVRDQAQLPIPLYTPPGALTLTVSVYHSANQQMSSWLDAQQNPQGVRIALDTVNVMRGVLPAKPEILWQAGEVALVDVGLLPDQAQPGDEWIFEATWHLEEAMPSAQIRLNWACEDGQRISSAALALTPLYAVEQWQRGEIWTGRQRVLVPGQLQSGVCQVLIERVGYPDSYVWGSTRISAPERSYMMPSMAYPLSLAWQNGIILLGYDWQDDQLQLYWSTQRALNQNLRLFVQALTPEGRVLWQEDEVPADWMRPTAGWDSGEIIITKHQVAFDDMSPYELIVGWYDPRDGSRIAVADGDADFARLLTSP